jgi:hypothetical protein
MMKPLDLSVDDRQFVAQAVRVAARQYVNDAARFYREGHHDLAAQLDLFANRAYLLAFRIDSREGVEHEG